LNICHIYGTCNLTIFEDMRMKNVSGSRKESIKMESLQLARTVQVDCYLPGGVSDPELMSLLIINDGQDMEELGFEAMHKELSGDSQISPLFCVAVHAGDRWVEFGTATRLDYKGRGGKAKLYSRFITDELIPHIQSTYMIPSFLEKSMAGFSLGGLSAMDIVWNHPQLFTKVGVFSGSLWWRSKSLDEGYHEDRDRIMHAQVRQGKYVKGLKFFFQTGALDEVMDRNNNGIIDSIDDTLGLIDELVKKGFHSNKDIHYIELQDGLHDIATWASVMPAFLKWGWGT